MSEPKAAPAFRLDWAHLRTIRQRRLAEFIAADAPWSLVLTEMLLVAEADMWTYLAGRISSDAARVYVAGAFQRIGGKYAETPAQTLEHVLNQLNAEGADDE